jgi:hypothetical protein
MYKMTRIKLFITGISIVLFAVAGLAQQEHSAENLAKITTNPIANMISLPFQFNFNFGMGDYNRYGTVLNLQPVIPFRLNDKWNVVNRIILPVMQKPDNSPEGSTYGIGDINMSMFFTPSHPGKLIWGIGPAFHIPTSSAPELGGDAFGFGPSIIIMLMTGNHWAFGLNANQTWSYKSSDLSSFFGQYMIIYNIKKGWFVNTMPTITADFTAAEGEQWTVPVGGGGGKVHKFGHQPIKFQLEAFYYVVKPTEGAEWTLQATVFLLFPKKKMNQMNQMKK